jgi:hypothetical protein
LVTACRRANAAEAGIGIAEGSLKSTERVIG